jgi:hypothetical protein
MTATNIRVVNNNIHIFLFFRVQGAANGFNCNFSADNFMHHEMPFTSSLPKRRICDIYGMSWAFQLKVSGYDEDGAELNMKTVFSSSLSKGHI